MYVNSATREPARLHMTDKEQLPLHNDKDDAACEAYNADDAAPAVKSEPWASKGQRYEYNAWFAPHSVGKAGNHGKRGNRRRAERRKHRVHRREMRLEIERDGEDAAGVGAVTRTRCGWSAPGEEFANAKTLLHWARRLHWDTRLVADFLEMRTGRRSGRQNDIIPYDCVAHDTTSVPSDVMYIVNALNDGACGSMCHYTKHDNCYMLPKEVVKRYGVESPATAPCAEHAFVCEDCDRRVCGKHCHGAFCAKCRQPMLCVVCVHDATCQSCFKVTDAYHCDHARFLTYEEDETYSQYWSRVGEHSARCMASLAAGLRRRRCRACRGLGEPSTKAEVQYPPRHATSREPVIKPGRRSKPGKHERRLAGSRNIGTDDQSWMWGWAHYVGKHVAFNDAPRPPLPASWTRAECD